MMMMVMSIGFAFVARGWKFSPFPVYLISRPMIMMMMLIGFTFAAVWSKCPSCPV